MHITRYLSLRKKNILILMNLYIIFILFISKLNSFYCAEQINKIGDGINETEKENQQTQKERNTETEKENQQTQNERNIENEREKERITIEKEIENEKEYHFETEYNKIIKQIIEENYNNSEHAYDAIKNELMVNYDKTETNYLKITTNNSYSFQLTTVNNQMDSLLNNIKCEFSVIDLKECTKKLNKEIGREEDADLIILKYENENQVDVNKKSIQYEIYNPENNNKLDLSVCSDTKIDIYIPVQLSEETQQLFEDLKSQGYNLFDKHDKFYTDICTPYKSKDGTDILLSDRLNEFFVNNELSCQANCEY